jgi:hypothetical protein
MIGSINMAEYSWKESPPDIEKTALRLPSDFLEHCPILLNSDNTINTDLIQSSSNQPFINQLTSWSSKQHSYLEKKPGALLIKVNPDELNDAQLKSLYYIISGGFGVLNNRYGELFDVKDKNLDYKKEAIPVSKTNASTGFHTDSTALEYSPDIVGLLCVQSAKTGGESILANATDLYLWMKQLYSEDLDILTEPIIRDVITPGSQADIEAIKKNRFPIFSFVNGVFKFRYMRYWIISGHNRCKSEISPELIRALDRIDEFFQQKEKLVFYRMVRGDILFVNNNFICHNRTEYQDYEEAGRKRTLVRTWINQ